MSTETRTPIPAAQSGPKPKRPAKTKRKMEPGRKNGPSAAGVVVRATAPAGAAQRISKLRRDAAARDPLLFAQTYLPHHFKLAPAPFHREILTLMAASATMRGGRLAVAAPRDHAKSTVVTLAYVLWAICFGRERFIVICSETANQAVEHLGHVRSELTGNPFLLEDFPGVCEVPGTRPRPPRWKNDDIITRGPEGGVRVLALGSGQSIRGRRNRSDRPTLIVCDDLESDRTMYSAEGRAKRREWFENALLKAGSTDTNVAVLGTVLHHDALLADLLDPEEFPGWTGRRYRAVECFSSRIDLWGDWEAIYRREAEHEGHSGPEAAARFFGTHRESMLEGTAVLWTQRRDYYQLMVQRLSDGVASFDREMQNDPTDDKDALFPEDGFRYWDDDFEEPTQIVRALGPDTEIIGACDPSMGTGGGDPSAIITAARAKDGTIYVLDADIRRRRPDQIIERIVQLHGLYGYRCFGVESVGFQKMIKEGVERAAAASRRYINLKELKPATSKGQRIESLQPLIAGGMIKLSRRHRVLIDQLRQYPHGRHDDGPDALEMVVQIASRPRARSAMFENGVVC